MSKNRSLNRNKQVLWPGVREKSLERPLRKETTLSWPCLTGQEETMGAFQIGFGPHIVDLEPFLKGESLQENPYCVNFESSLMGWCLSRHRLSEYFLHAKQTIVRHFL